MNLIAEIIVQHYFLHQNQIEEIASSSFGSINWMQAFRDLEQLMLV